jgi:hypothetical protein
MNWNSPRADEVVAAAFGLKLDSIFAVASRYSKLAPVVEAACLIEPAILARAGSTPAAAVALAESIAMFPVPCSSRKLARALEALAISAHARPRLRHLWLMES